ncbi:hypothetical protein SUDANB58_00495 [Streptomyces sp. enrichment culture]|uniref:acyl carrier protein n=1 Tax=Streptomyces sp. enrichment culture TaxID=1795815 RepID=UPI003F564A0D
MTSPSALPGLHAPTLGLGGRTALVTGAAGGIGRACALRLAAAGAEVRAVDRDAAGLEDLAGRARGPAGAVEPRVVDLTDLDAAELPGTDPGGVPVDRLFFELGATSLILGKAHLRLRAELDERLTVVDLFAHPSVAAPAAFIGQRTGSHGGAARAAIPGGADALLDSAQARRPPP